MPAKKKSLKSAKSVKMAQQKSKPHTPHSVGGLEGKPVNKAPVPQQYLFRISNPNVRKIGHNAGGFLPRYRKVG